MHKSTNILEFLDARRETGGKLNRFLIFPNKRKNPETV